MYDLAIERFNELDGNEDRTLARGFWNGYGAAMSILRDIVRWAPHDYTHTQSKVQ
jgi:hypothetical protein